MSDTTEPCPPSCDCPVCKAWTAYQIALREYHEEKRNK